MQRSGVKVNGRMGTEDFGCRIGLLEMRELFGRSEKVAAPKRLGMRQGPRLASVRTQEQQGKSTANRPLLVEEGHSANLAVLPYRKGRGQNFPSPGVDAQLPPRT